MKRVEELIHLTRLFPKIKISLGEHPAPQKILEHGFDIKISKEIKEKLASIQEGDYLVIYPAGKGKELLGLNLKLKKAE